MPEGRPIFSTRCMMMNTAFATTASVSAICSPTRIAPVLLRSMALRMGRSSICKPLKKSLAHWLTGQSLIRNLALLASWLVGLHSLRLQMRRRLDAADAPRRIETRDQSGDERDAERDQAHGEIEVRERLEVLVHLAHAGEPERAEADADHAARDADHADLDEVLAEDHAL